MPMSDVQPRKTRRITFKDMPDWQSTHASHGGLNYIYNPEGEYVGRYSVQHKLLTLIVEHKRNTIVTYRQYCRNIHQAMRLAYLKTQKSIK